MFLYNYSELHCFLDLSWEYWPQNELQTYQQANDNRHLCPKCSRSYKNRGHMVRHFRYECGILKRFECPYCNHRYRQRTIVWRHMIPAHPDKEMYCIDILTNNKLYKNDHICK